MPNLLQSSRTPCRYPSGGIRMPFVPGHRLQDEGGDRLRSLELDRFLEQFERGRGVVEPALRAVIGIQDVHDPGHRRDLVRPATRVARHRHRGVRRAVVAAIPSQHLLPSGHGLRHLDRVLVGLGAAEREERLLDRTGPQAGQTLAEHRASLEGVERRQVGQFLRLTCDRVGHALVAVSDVHPHQLGAEVEPPPPVDPVHVHAFGAVDRERRHLGLHVPVVHRVPLGVGHDLLCRHGAGLDGHPIVLPRLSSYVSEDPASVADPTM